MTPLIDPVLRVSRDRRQIRVDPVESVPEDVLFFRSLSLEPTDILAGGFDDGAETAQWFELPHAATAGRPEW